MTPEAFGRALERARLRSERHVPTFQATYAKIITGAADKASRALVSQAALTASDWQPPPEGTLISGLGVTVALREQQLGAVETVVRVPLEQAGIAWNADDPLLQAFLQQTEAWSGLSIEQAFQPELRSLITDAFSQGLSVKDAAALIRAKFAETSIWQAEMLARSNLNMIGNGGMQVAVTRYNEKASAAGDRLVETKTWVTAGDAAVRASHRQAAGQVVPVDQSFQVGSSMLSFPGDPGGALAEVLNCFPADTRADVWDLRGATRRWYEGDLVRIRFASGDELSATPNHPVLGEHGWTSIGEVEEGEYLVCGAFYSSALRAPDPENPPPEIGEVYRLAEVAGSAERIRGTPPDFHGDGLDGEVDVVTVDGRLRIDDEAAREQQIVEFGLALAGHARACSRATDGAAMADVAPILARRGNAGTASLVRGGNDRASLLIGGEREPDRVGFAATADRQAHLRQVPHDDVAADTEFGGDAEDAFPPFVSLAEVVRVERVAFRGHVFNVESGEGWYIANGIIARNCRCVALYGESVRPRLAASAAAPKIERPEPADGIDERIAAGLDALSQAADFASRMAHVEQERDVAARARDAAIGERDDLRRQLAAEREENRALIAAEKKKTLEHIESLTARFADRKPRAVEIVRDESGRAVGYREATDVDR